MKLKAWAAILVLAILALAGSAHAVPARPPAVIIYQGSVFVDNRPFEGTGYFKLALVDADGVTLWSNDGTLVADTEPAASVAVAIQKGVVQIPLGDTSIAGMQAIDPAIFNTAKTVYLRTWFDDGTNGSSELVPRLTIASTVYAFNTDFLDGYSSEDFFLNTSQIVSSQIAPAAVSTTQIADASVTPDKITVFSNSGNNLTIGSGAAATNIIYANQGAANNPALRFNSGTTTWQFSNNGTIWTDIGAGGGGAVTSVFGRAGAVVAQANDYTWAQINKAISSLADITTRSAGDLSSGNLLIARMPTGGAWTLASDLNVDTNTFVLDFANNRVGVGTNAPAVGLDVAGDIRAQAQGDVRFADSDSSNFVALQSPAVVGGNVTWTLPAADGAAGQVLSTNGAGTLNWSAAGAVSSVFARTGAVTAQANDYTWGQIDKTTSSIANITTRSAGDLSSGNLAIARMPTGGAWTLASDLNVDTNTFVLDFTNNRVGVGTNAPAVGLDVAGDIRAQAQGDVRFADSDSSNYVAFQSPAAVVADVTWTLPAADGAGGQFLSTNGSGVLSWAAAAGGVSSVFTRTGAVTAQANDYTWAQIDKTTSSIADITTRSAGDLSTGNLAIARMPTGGAWTLASDLNIDSNSLVVDFTNNRVGVGTAAPAVILDVVGDELLRGQGDLRFGDADSSNYVAFQSPAVVGANVTWTLPAADGAGGQFLSTNGSGVLSWAAAAGGVSSVFTRTGAVTAQANDYTWAQIDKTTSSIADITTRSAGDLSTGNLAIARMPTGGAWTLASDLNIDSNSLVVDFTNNRVGVGTALPLVALDVVGNALLEAQGDVRFGDADTSNWVAFQAPAAVAADVTWTLPAADGTSGQVLSTNGSGTLSWSSASNPTMDTTYNNFGAAAPTIVVDAAQGQLGPLTFQSNTTSTTGDIAIDLNSTGDFIIKDATTAFVTFNDDSTTDFSANIAADRIIDITQGGNGGGTLITNAGTGNGIYIDQNGTVGVANDNGAFVVENTGQNGRAMSVYSNQGATQSQSLVQIYSDNAAFDEKVAYLRSDGANTGLEIDTNTGSGTGAPMRLVPSATPSTNLAGGQMFFDSTTNLLYYYDSSRSKWLSVEGYNLEYGTEGNSDGAPLAYGGDMINTNTGARMPYAGTIVYVTAMQNGGLATKQLNVQINGATSFSFSLVASVYSETNRNQNFAANDYLSCATDAAGAAATDPSCILFVKWRK